jgi:protein gp37
MTKIEWTDIVWNPITGCSKISAGCLNCYAETIANRFWGDRQFSDVQFHPERLEYPLKWKKPCRVFVNSMSDLFHHKVTDEQIEQIFEVMKQTPQHTYQVLTKRPERMMEWVNSWYTEQGSELGADYRDLPPFENIWLGVSTENQREANKRIPYLRHTHAAVRFLSCEPLLDKIELFEVDGEVSKAMAEMYPEEMLFPADVIDWIIIGGESGNQARQCHLDWVRSLVQQCQSVDIPVFVKQLGKNAIGSSPYMGTSAVCNYKLDLKDPKGGDINEFPEDVRIRQFPEVKTTRADFKIKSGSHGHPRVLKSRENHDKRY